MIPHSAYSSLQNEYPMLWALVTYLAQFDVLPPSPAPAPARPGPTGGSPLVDLGLPFSPDMFVDVLNRFSPNNQHRGLRRARYADSKLEDMRNPEAGAITALQQIAESDSGL
jgi:hypothetical protein